MFEWHTWTGTIVACVIALTAAAVGVLALRVASAVIGRRARWAVNLYRRLRGAWATVCIVVALWIACGLTAPSLEPWWVAVSRVFLVAAILAGAWLVSALVSYGFENLIERESVGVVGAQSRRRRTQVIVLHRLALVAIGVLAVGAVLFSFPQLRVIGTSLLASAGIASVIAGLAAQSIFGNLIAGIQIAFNDAIRVGDVVVVEGEWGRIGEINLSYVVVYIWDERRLVIPCSYFTTTPIETWTRRSDKILGTVFLDLDWRVPMDAVRARFLEIVHASSAWDGRSASAQVTDAQGGFVTVRFVMSAKDSSDQWDIRCEVREQLVDWLQREHPEALPVGRVEGRLSSGDPVASSTP